MQVNNTMYYQVLDIEKTATETDVKKAYRRQALRFPFPQKCLVMLGSRSRCLDATMWSIHTLSMTNSRTLRDKSR